MTANSTIADRIASAIMDTIEREKRINRDDLVRTVEVTMLADQAERARKAQSKRDLVPSVHVEKEMSSTEVANRKREWLTVFEEKMAQVSRDQTAFERDQAMEQQAKAETKPSDDWVAYLSGEIERQERAHVAMMAAKAKAAQEAMELQVYPAVFIGLDTAAPGTVTWVDATVAKADLPRTPAAIKADIKPRRRMNGE